MCELKGESAINRNDAGRTAILGDLGFRVNLKAVGRAQPRLCFAFVFPLNNWNAVTSTGPQLGASYSTFEIG